MNNATDTMIGSFFSDEAERIKKRSWTSLWIAMALTIPSTFMTMAGFFCTIVVSVMWGLFIMFFSLIGFFTGVAFMARFVFLRMKLNNYVGAQVRKRQNQPDNGSA